MAFFLLVGPVHPGLCPRLPLGQSDGQSVLWAAEGRRDGGNMLVAPKDRVQSQANTDWVPYRPLLHPQHLLERSWYAVTETCLAFTVFRDDFSPRFVALFTLLLFLKCFHWLAEDRVDFVSWE